MGKKKGWFDRLKRFFSSDPKTKSEKNERRKKWLLWRLRSKYTPALPAPSLGKGRLLREAEDEQSKHAMAVAIATAAAAEAAVAAAQAAAEVVRLTGKPSYFRNQEAAAIKIQSAFRGYLARKALRALKGLVILQALIRGQTVRRQTTATLKGLQSLIKLQSQARASRSRTSEDHEGCEFKDIIYMNPDELTNTKATKNERRWDNSTLSKEEISGVLKSRREAMLKRLRAMEYATFYQERRNLQKPNTPTTAKEILPDDLNDRWSWLEQWVGTQPVDKEVLENCKTSPGKFLTEQQYQVRSAANSLECQVNEKEEEAQLRYLARRSFNRSRRTPNGDDDSFSSSPLFPSYMASTASTKARFRSMSTPKQRMAAADISSDRSSVHANRTASPVPSIVSEVSLSRASKSPLIRQQSPRLGGHTLPVKSHRSPNYFSFDSKFSSLNWDQFDGLR